TAMHATLQLDGREQAPLPPGRPFALPDRARGELLGLERGQALEVASARHRGYAPIEHRRTVTLGEDFALVVDDLRGAGRHALVSRFHLAHARAIRRKLTEAELRALKQLPLIADWDLDSAVQLAPGAVWIP